MEKKWKLIHKENYHLIENKGGLTLGYSPGAGIHILEDDGFAFKDFSDNGIIDTFEDWRQPMVCRVRNFASVYHLNQVDGMLTHLGKAVKIHDEIQVSKMFETLVQRDVVNNYPDMCLEENREYLSKHYLLVILIMMMDNIYGDATHDYHIQVFLQGLECGMMDRIIYSLGVSLKQFMDKMLHHSVLNVQKQVM